MKEKILPQTVLGKWSLKLFLVFLASLATLMAFAASGQEGGETVFDNLYLGIPGILAAISVMASCITGAVSIFSKKERSLLIFAVAFLTLLAAIFIIGDMVTPD